MTTTKRTEPERNKDLGVTFSPLYFDIHFLSSTQIVLMEK